MLERRIYQNIKYINSRVAYFKNAVPNKLYDKKKIDRLAKEHVK